MLASVWILLLSTALYDVVAARDVPILAARDSEGPSPSLSYDPNTSKYCSWWVDITSTPSCSVILENNFISLQEFIRWNPSITADCGNLVTGKSYCVETTGEPPASTITTSKSSTTTSTNPVTSTSSTKISKTTSSQTTTTTGSPNGIETPTPTQPSIASNCDKFYLVKQGDTCEAIGTTQGITLAQFLAWNPSAGSSCTGLWADAYACVSIIGHEATTTTTTTAGNGIATPTPIQPSMVSNCDSFYKVKSGDTCATIASSHGISVSQITTWNPAVGSSCTTLWLDYYICISIVGHTPTTTSPGNGIATPTPTQSGMTPNCKTFHLVKSGESCATIASQYHITVAQFVSWNPASGGTSCTGLWANTYACVAIL
ncbi:LysM domain-containing protein [Poronia punctata]|nr:LysM domain-containing protein [Poronia punctata]